MLFHHYLFYIFGTLFFLLDIFCLTFFEKQIFYFLLCYYILYIYQEEKQLNKFIIAALLISLESLLDYGIFGVPLILLIPITFIAHYIHKLFYAASLQPYIILIGFILAQSLFIDPYILQIDLPVAYTNSKIIANIIVLWSMSLIVSSQGNLSNRFNLLWILKRKVRTPNE